MPVITGGQSVIQQLRSEGVEVVFGLPGVQIMHIYDGFFTTPEVRVITTRHEQSTAYMADGYARSTGKIGVCLVVPGPGAYNAGAAMATAYAASSPVLMISGQIDSSLIGTGRGALHEVHDQLEFMAPVTKWTDRITRAEDIPAGIHEAIRQLKTGRPRPVELEIPPDILATETSIEIIEPEEYARPAAQDDVLRSALERLATAKKPLIWAGGGVNLAGAWDELREVAETLGAPVVLTREGKGALPDTHPQAMMIGQGDMGAGPELMPQADVILAVGTRFNIPETAEWKPRPDQTVIHMDVDEEEFRNNITPTIGVIADAKEGLGQMARGLRGRSVQSSWDKESLAEIKSRHTEMMRERTPEFSQAYGVWEEVRKDLPEETIVIGGVTGGAQFGGSAFATLRPRTLISSSYMGTLGYGFPTGLGAKVGNPDTPVLALVGDGGFMYAIGELATAVQYGINLVTVLFNNHRYGASNDDQRNRFKGNVVGTELHNPDFVPLAESFGAKGIKVTELEQFPAAVREAVAANSPVLIDVDGAAAQAMDRPRTT
ncbi:MAG: thiamine pyrophosphate-binding protein [Chloroflexi bacterium]|nr:thiamine pyrophosphate-binding protein [Chloroflexota bacterium]